MAKATLAPKYDLGQMDKHKKAQTQKGPAMVFQQKKLSKLRFGQLTISTLGHVRFCPEPS
jgi:hypothetical protein